MLSPTSRDFNQSLLDFFNPVDLQLILMLICESLNLIISGNHCWAVKLKAIMKRSEVESSLSSSLTVLHAWCASPLSYWKQKLSLATCLIAVNICWDSVLKYLTDSVRWLSVLAEKKLSWRPISWQTWWTPIVCISDRWMLCALCWCIQFDAYRWSFYEWTIVSLWPGGNFHVFCVFVSRATYSI